MVDGHPEQQFEVERVVADGGGHPEGNEQVDSAQQQFQDDDARQVLGQQLAVPRDVAVVEVGDAHVEQHVEEIGEVEDGEIETVVSCADTILHSHIHPENPEVFDQQIQENQNGDIEYEVSFLHFKTVCKNTTFFATMFCPQLWHFFSFPLS